MIEQLEKIFNDLNIDKRNGTAKMCSILLKKRFAGEISQEYLEYCSNWLLIDLISKDEFYTEVEEAEKHLLWAEKNCPEDVERLRNRLNNIKFETEQLFIKLTEFESKEKEWNEKSKVVNNG